MKRNFNDWLAQFRSSIANYEYGSAGFSVN